MIAQIIQDRIGASAESMDKRRIVSLIVGVAAATAAATAVRVGFEKFRNQDTPNVQGTTLQKSILDSCIKSSGAPASSARAQTYCRCFSDIMVRSLSFDEMVVLANQINKNNIDSTNSELLSASNATCLSKAAEAPT